MQSFDETSKVGPKPYMPSVVVRKNSVNPETMYSKGALIRANGITRTRNDMKTLLRISAT